MSSVTSQLSMLALHEVGARLDMRTSNDCGFPHISSLDAHNITTIQLLQRRCTLVVVRLLSLLSALQVTVCVYHVRLQQPGLCSNALAFANASANAAFAFALALDSFAADAFALAFAFDSSAFAFALAFDSNAFD